MEPEFVEEGNDHQDEVMFDTSNEMGLCDDIIAVCVHRWNFAQNNIMDNAGVNLHSSFTNMALFDLAMTSNIKLNNSKTMVEPTPIHVCAFAECYGIVPQMDEILQGLMVDNTS